MKKPCNECPYRKDSMKGWLGEDFHNPTRFLEQLEMPDAHPCHKAVDWEAENVDEEMEDAPKCIGSLQFMNNSMMKSRYSHVLALQNEVGKNEEVMQFKHNFIKHSYTLNSPRHEAALTEFKRGIQELKDSFRGKGAVLLLSDVEPKIEKLICSTLDNHGYKYRVVGDSVIGDDHESNLIIGQLLNAIE